MIMVMKGETSLKPLSAGKTALELGILPHGEEITVLMLVLIPLVS